MTNQYVEDFEYRRGQTVRVIGHPRDIVAPATSRGPNGEDSDADLDPTWVQSVVNDDKP